MSIRIIKRRQVLAAIILLSLLIALASIIIQVNEQKLIDRIFTTEGSFSYSSNPNRPFLYYEVRVEEGDTINFMEIMLNESLPIPFDWGLDITVYDENHIEIEGNSINDILIYKCLTRNMTFTAYQISYLLVYFTIEVEAFYYEASSIILYLSLSLILIWCAYLAYIMIKRRKETEKWLKPFRK